MNHADWLELMRFPPEWMAWHMIPEALATIQLAGYEPGHEDASEHDRHGAFQWWLKRESDPETLIRLVKLSWLDPDVLMGRSVRKCIAELPNCNSEVRIALDTPYRRA
jgi:hypothetical protein